jgi:hypothetical protein
MSKLRLLVAGVVGAVLALGISYGVESFAQGSGSVTTLYACLGTAGKPLKVKTSPLTCAAGNTQVSWYSYPPSASGTPQCTGYPHVGIDLSGCDLQGADFGEADLSNATLVGANLADTNFKGANSSANLSGANLQNANLQGANFNLVNVERTQLAGAVLAGLDDGSGVFGTPASLPSSWEVAPSGATGYWIPRRPAGTPKVSLCRRS